MQSWTLLTFLSYKSWRFAQLEHFAEHFAGKMFSKMHRWLIIFALGNFACWCLALQKYIFAQQKVLQFASFFLMGFVQQNVQDGAYRIIVQKTHGGFAAIAAGHACKYFAYILLCKNTFLRTFCWQKCLQIHFCIKYIFALLYRGEGPGGRK